MPEKIQTALQSLPPRLPDGGRLPQHTLYTPPTSLPMPPLRELRTIHRTWLTPSALGHGKTDRPLPQSFMPAAGAPSGALPAAGTLVLAPIDPWSFARHSSSPPLARAGAAGGGGGAGGAGGGRLPQVEVERHPAASSVVARRMLKQYRRTCSGSPPLRRRPPFR